jgi:UDP-glucose 4-epimerase
MNKKIKKYLVTGGCGFIGSNLVDKLVDQGHSVTVIDNLSSESSSIEYRNPKAEYHISDIMDIFLCLDGVQFDVVFHLAANGRIQPSFNNPAGWFWNNAMGTVNVLDFARKSGCKSFVYATTSSKNHGSHLITPYTFSKVVGEDACRMYADLYDMNIAQGTFYNVYGPREPKTGEFATVTEKFLRQYESGEFITVVGDGKQTRDFTHVDDICEGLIKISEGQWRGHNFDLGKGESISILDLALTICQENQDIIKFVPLRKNEGLHTLSDYKTTERILGWKAKKNIKDYIKQRLNRNF